MSTGVRILPRDTAGYLYDDCPCTYQGARSMQERYAELYPAKAALFADQARRTNTMHLRRLLRQAVFDKHGGHGWDQLDRWFFENLPRPDRRRWQRILAEPPPKWTCSPPGSLHPHHDQPGQV